MYFLLINYGIQNPPLNKRVGSSPTLGTNVNEVVNHEGNQ